MKKIVVDLDIITVAMWDKKGASSHLARELMGRIEKGEFDMVTPFIILEMLSRWRYSALAEDIQQFYLKYTKEFITNEDLDVRLDLLKVDDEKILSELKTNGVKGEDALLALMTAVFDIDYLITFNRKHLKGKKELIKRIMIKNDVRPIQIIGPEEI